MKILLCGPYAYKNQAIVGGVEAVLENLRLGFNRYEPNLSIEVVSGSNKAVLAYERYKNITYIKQPKRKLGSVFISQYPLRIKRFLNKNDFDILNAHEIDFAYYGLNINEKLLLTLHGVTWEEKKYLPKYKQPLWDFLYVKKLNKILKNLKYLVSINPYIKELIKNKTNATIFDIYNPVPNEFFKIEDRSQEKRMFYIGVISRRKNLLTLMKSLVLVKKEIKDFKLVVAGKIGNRDYFDEIMNYIKKNNLTDNIEYLGKITEEQKFQEFSKMSFLILPSFQETAPMVISEAFATGKPVVGSNICGIPYMLDNERNGLLVNPTDEKDISSKILYILENPEKTHSMGINGKKYAQKYHCLKTVVDKYRKAYEEIMARS
jgi:glycosyltransferase involved in cell wall biosynthesis